MKAAVLGNLNISRESKRFFSNFLSLGILQGANYIFPLITLPYLVRIIGAEKFGLLAFATTTITYFVIITDFGFNLSATREISINRDNKKKIIEIFSAVFFIKIILLFFAFFLLTFLIIFFQKFKKDALVYFLTFGTVVGQVLFPIWFFQGMEKMKYITFLNIFSKSIFTFSIFVFVKEPNDYLLVPVLTSLGFIISGIFALFIIKKNFQVWLQIVSFCTVKYYFCDSCQYFLSRISVSIYTSSNIFVLGLFTNNVIVGYYSIGEKIYQALQGLYNPLITALYPLVAKEKNVSFFKKIFFSVTFFNIFVVILFFFKSSDILFFLFKLNELKIINKILQILLVSSLFVVPSVLLGYPFLGALGKSKYANMSVIFGSIVHIILLCTIGFLGLISGVTVALSVLFTETCVLFYRLFYSKRLGLWERQ